MIGATTTHEVSTDATAVDDVAATWINTANIKELTMADESRDTSEDAYLDNADKYKEFVAGMIDGGEIGLTLKWDRADTGQVALNGAFEGDGYIYGKIKFPVAGGNHDIFVYQAVVTGRGVEIPKNETITQSFTLKVTGAPLWGTEAAA